MTITQTLPSTTPTSWEKVKTTDPLWENRIKDAVDHELQAKGWQRVDQGGDVAITAVGSAHDQREYQTFYDGLGGWRWGGLRRNYNAGGKLSCGLSRSGLLRCA